VPLRAKLMAVSGMASGYALFWFGYEPTPAAAFLVALFMVMAAIYVVSRPAPAPSRTPTRNADAGGVSEKPSPAQGGP
jgi:hypothetical protein